MIDSPGRKILVRNLSCDKRKSAEVSVDRAIRQRVQSQVWFNIRIDNNISRRELSVAGIRRWNGVQLRDAQALTQTFVRTEEECPVFKNRTSEAAAELISFERGNATAIKIVTRIQCTVA